jgi:peptidoglycan/LPS O-acetylase OafA/YrhL
LLEARPLGWLGRISYGAYLWNWPLCIVVWQVMGEAHTMTQTVIVWATTVAAGALSHYYVEAPFLRLKHRLEGGAARVPSPTDAGANPRSRAA